MSGLVQDLLDLAKIEAGVEMDMAPCQIAAVIAEIVDQYRPAIVSIESVFMARNAGSALKLGHARSAAMCATFAFDVDVFEYSPREIKLAVVGTGAATKEQVQHMVVSLLQLDGAPAADAADALAAAICHAHRRRIEGQLDDDVVLASLR